MCCLVGPATGLSFPPEKPFHLLCGIPWLSPEDLKVEINGTISPLKIQLLLCLQLTFSCSYFDLFVLKSEFSTKPRDYFQLMKLPIYMCVFLCL